MTIMVDSDTCTRCGICSTVCVMAIITQPDDLSLPRIPEEKTPMCISCGQCEAFCQTGALIREENQNLNQESAWDGKGLSPALLSTYIKSRRSIRNYRSEPVDKETIESILDIARYAASGGNRQPVEWLVIMNSEEVRKIAVLTINWIRTLVGTPHPMSGYVPRLISSWESGIDVVFRGAPHLLVAHIPEDNPLAPVDGIIALTHVDIAAPLFGVGTCWAGFASIAAASHLPVQKAYGLPDGRIPAYIMMFGYPKYTAATIPARKPLTITWKE
ncbi:MAG: nitroreductase [Methanomicrobiales archaeon HGW-Methanomicrobiales-4]|nr:MAG: nitroreductase [Methanomicrobiales archaeon HGW-Methanomicrobiales-4]